MTRSSFSAAWAAAASIYSPHDTAEIVAKAIGGNVARNIRNTNEAQRWSNTCAVRLSHALNLSGTQIPKISGKTVSGTDGRWYFYRIGHVIEFLIARWGRPEIVDYPPHGGGALAGRKGLIVFQISGFPDARGHATLWDGAQCYDRCYFNGPEVAYRTDRANFWSMS